MLPVATVARENTNHCEGLSFPTFFFTKENLVNAEDLDRLMYPCWSAS